MRFECVQPMMMGIIDMAGPMMIPYFFEGSNFYLLFKSWVSQGVKIHYMGE